MNDLESIKYDKKNLVESLGLEDVTLDNFKDKYLESINTAWLDSSGHAIVGDALSLSDQQREDMQKLSNLLIAEDKARDGLNSRVKESATAHIDSSKNIEKANKLIFESSKLEDFEINYETKNMDKDEELLYAISESQKIYAENLKAVGLEDRTNSRPSQLSGGEQQRVAVARALASKPKFILADEPTANLDSKSTERLLNIMEELNKKENITFIFSTHDQRVVKKARRVITIEDGKVVKDESK